MTTSTMQRPHLTRSLSPKSPASVWSTMAHAKNQVAPTITQGRSTSERTSQLPRCFETQPCTTQSPIPDLLISFFATSQTEPITPVTPSARLSNAHRKTSTANTSLIKYRSATVATVPSRSALKPALSHVLTHVRVHSSMASVTSPTSLSLASYIISTSHQPVLRPTKNCSATTKPPTRPSYITSKQATQA